MRRHPFANPLLAAALLVAVASGRPSSFLVAAPLAAVDQAPTQEGSSPRSAVRRSRFVAVTLDAMPTPGADGGLADARPSIRLDLFDDVSITAVFDRFDVNPTGTTWVGHVANVPGSIVTLVYGDGVMTGSVLTPEATYVVRPAPESLPTSTPELAGSLHVVEDIDQSGFRPEGPMIEVVLPEAAADGAGFEVHGDPADVIDVMVVYTPAARAYTGSVAAMQNQIGVAISQTNTAYANSGVIQRLRLVHTAEVPYVTSGNASTDLSNLRSGVGGLSGVGALRNTYGADMVALVQYDSASPYCGIGYLMTSPSAFFANYAFSVTEVDCITNHTFAHELGHNMGLRHDWYMDNATSPYTYAHGHVNTGAAGNRWRTIMSYNNICSAQGYNCTRLLAWSNPNLTHNGHPTGIAGGTNTTCAPGSLTANTCDADERQVLNNTASVVANFRQAVVLPAAFAKTSPSNGASYQPGSVTLAWQSAAGASSYEYCLDTTVNGTCNTSWTTTGASLSVAVTGLVAATTYEWQVRAVSPAGSTTANGGAAWTFSVGPAPGANIVTNGTFASGTSGWQTFATPSSAYIVSNVTSGVMQFYRVPPPAGTTNQAVVLQRTGMPLAADAPALLQFSLGNSDAVRKRVSVLLHDADFSDLSVCTFWLPAGTSLTSYTMRTHTTRAWTNATVSFYAASEGSSGGAYRIDNVTLQYAPTQSATRTDCVDPFAPGSTAQADASDLLLNGGFSTGALAPGWTTFGTITHQIANGVFQFIRPSSATPTGVVLQQTGRGLATNSIVTSTFQLGNSSGVRKRVTAVLHDADFSDLTACTFWLAPGQALSTYTMRGFTTRAWTNATISIYPSTNGLESWIRLDNVTLRPTPAAAILGTECLEPGSSADARGATSPDGPPAVPAGADVAQDNHGVATTAADGPVVFNAGAPIDLTTALDARLTFSSWLTPVGSRGLVETSLDGVVWHTVQVVDSSDTWMPVEVDLRTWLGSRLHVRLVVDPVVEPGHSTPTVWNVDDIVVDIDGVTIDPR